MEASAPVGPGAPRTQLEREILKLEKKVREIQRLQQRLNDGEALEQLQLDKLARGEELGRKLAELHLKHALSQAQDSKQTEEQAGDVHAAEVVMSQPAVPDQGLLLGPAAGCGGGATSMGRTPLRAPPPGMEQWTPGGAPLLQWLRMPQRPLPVAGGCQGAVGAGMTVVDAASMLPPRTPEEGQGAGDSIADPGPPPGQDMWIQTMDNMAYAQAFSFGAGGLPECRAEVAGKGKAKAAEVMFHPSAQLPFQGTGDGDMFRREMPDEHFNLAGLAADGMPGPMAMGPDLQQLQPGMELQDRWEVCWEWVRTGWCPRGLTCRWEHPPLAPVGFTSGLHFWPSDAAMEEELGAEALTELAAA